MPSPNTIPVLERSIDLLSAIAESPSGLSAKELTLQLGIPPATCYRILRTLTQKHLLRERPNGSYLPAYGLARLARSWSGMESRLEEIKPQLDELSRRMGLSAKISIREGTSAVVVMRTEAHRPNSITSPIGSKISLTEAGSAGITLLASLPTDKRPLLLKDSDRSMRANILRKAAAAEKEGCARSYGTDHPSIYAISKLIDIGIPAATTLIGWPEDFAGQRRILIENALRESLAEFATT